MNDYYSSNYLSSIETKTESLATKAPANTSTTRFLNYVGNSNWIEQKPTNIFEKNDLEGDADKYIRTKEFVYNSFGEIQSIRPESHRLETRARRQCARVPDR